MDATVIQLANRAGRRRTTARPPSSPDPAPGDADPVADRIGAQVQALFAYHGRSLTNEGTAQDFTITMDGVIGLVDGALATGVIDPVQHGMLKAAFEGMRNVPRTL